MGFVRIFIFLATLVTFIYANVENQNEFVNYSSDDTVSLEALADEQDASTISVDDDATTTSLPPEGRQIPQASKEDAKYCVTNTGLSGTCTSVKECFPRLFPLETTDNDTPLQTGVYNTNLAKLLIEASGVCEPSVSRQAGTLNADSFPVVCCAASKVSGDFPLDNDTSSVDLLDNKCGLLKIDQSLLPSVDKIVGGRKAVLGEFPWMVAMLRRGQQFCGGSLLDNRNVLTAAHCVEFMTKNDVAALRLHIGDLDIASTKEARHVERKAKRVLYHRGFTMKNLEHDIAIIHLDKAVEFSKTIQPVCLHSGNPAYDTGKMNADVAGWGTTYSGGPQSSALLAVNLNVITQAECNKKYAEAKKKIGPGMVCAGSKGKDSCQGDSGGPLVVDARGQGKQIGIVSWGIGCASYPGVYTRVDKYMKWINKNKQ